MTDVPDYVRDARKKALKTLRAITAKYGRDSLMAEPHELADAALLQFFIDIGMQDIVDEFNSVEPKWYA